MVAMQAKRKKVPSNLKRLAQVFKIARVKMNSKEAMDGFLYINVQRYSTHTQDLVLVVAGFSDQVTVETLKQTRCDKTRAGRPMKREAWEMSFGKDIDERWVPFKVQL